MLSTCYTDKLAGVSKKCILKANCTYTEVLQVVKANCIAEEMKQRILEHASVAVTG